MIRYYCDGCGPEITAAQAQQSVEAARQCGVQSQQLFCAECLPGAPEYWAGPYSDLMKELASLTESRLKNKAREFFKRSKLREVKTANS